MATNTPGKNFVCYFCNRTIDGETQQGHLSVCSAMLEPCEFKCGAYIQKASKAQHQATCQNNLKKKAPRSVSTDNGGFEQRNKVNYEGPNSIYGTTARTKITSPPPLNSIYSNGYPNGEVPQYGTIDRRRATQMSHATSTMALNYDNQNFQAIDAALKSLTARLNTFANDRVNIAQTIQANNMHHKVEIERLNTQIQTLHEYRAIFNAQIESLKRDTLPVEKLVSDNEVTTHNIKELIKEIGNLSNAISAIKITQREEQINASQVHENFLSKLKEFEDHYITENAATAGLWKDQKTEIETLHQRSKDIDLALEKIRDQINGLSLDVRTASDLSVELVENIKKQNEEIEETKKSVAQIKLDVELAEDHFSNLQGFVCNTAGRMVWKISDFQARLQLARKQECVPIKSPIFYSEDYGYKIRLLAYLNGLKKWKGRFLLCCLQVIKGEYDDLLKWPCKIEANVILRDCENFDEPSNYERYIAAKRQYPNDELEDPQESSTQYIFIPHTTLTKSCYLVNDTIYLEVKTYAGKSQQQQQFKLTNV